MLSCTLCDNQSNNENELKSHMETHKTEEEVLLQGKVQGYRRSSPANMAEATKLPQTIDTLCHICSLRCQTKQKLQTHMKNHKDGDQLYNMSELKQSISAPAAPQENPLPTHGKNSDETCRKCGNKFQIMEELKKPLRVHTKFIPCKNFSSQAQDNKCSWGEKCGYSHKVFGAGTYICWDCGKSSSDKNDLPYFTKR